MWLCWIVISITLWYKYIVSLHIPSDLNAETLLVGSNMITVDENTILFNNVQSSTHYVFLS